MDTGFGGRMAPDAERTEATAAAGSTAGSGVTSQLTCPACGRFPLARMYFRADGRYTAAGWMCTSCRYTAIDPVTNRQPALFTEPDYSSIQF